MPRLADDETLATLFDLWADAEAVLVALGDGREPDRRTAPTRSTPSSTAISRPAGSAARAQGRSR